MEKFENEKLGVLGHRIEDHHYIVDIRWKDGKESQHNFPEKGFPVVDPQTHQKLGFISGEKALRILENNAALLNEEDFSWIDFVNSSAKKAA
jgi:hypothetical protein